MRRFLLRHALLPDGWHDDVLVSVDAAGLIARATPKSVDATATLLDGPVLPGLPNLHSHAFQRAMAGLAERSGPGQDSFWTWRETMYGFASRLTPEDIEAIAGQLYAEMLEAGFTAVAEFHYVHHQPGGAPYDDPAELSRRVIAAADTAGIGLTHLPVLYRYGGFGSKEPQPRQRRFLHDAEAYARLLQALAPAFRGRSDRRLGIAPHSLRAVSPELLRDGIAALNEIDAAAPIHIHIAEQTAEVDDCLAWSGKRPVQWLLDQGIVDRRWCLVHATHLDEDEVLRLAASQAVAGFCPTTEANLGDGLFPAVDYMAADGRIGIGSDSHISVSVTEELRLLEYGQRLVRRSRTLLAGGPDRSNGRRLFEAAARGGAQALGQPMGAIAPGHRADFVLLDADAPSLTARRGDAVLDAWIFSNQARSAIRDVYVAGSRVVEQGRHIRSDSLAAAYRKTLGRLLQD
ncbi:MAG: formimidoylglutamate deiminase [Ferrovibrio sp.]|uniref:formimidoylglutamate deiminase n=1 Tax=Ferrovibrio sp. TaxID=1917215 RepID=UPI00262185AD|nr:formimidoylglutamate deiminase [Ferrovibrio sp.]MCW0233424.1 formimidoylglutamate deiminase [Ferrovibrio sp.]